MKLQDLLKDIELGKVYTDKDRKPFKVNEDKCNCNCHSDKIDEGFGGVTSPPPFSSKEAKMIVDDALRQYSKELRKLQGRVVKDWMTKAKAGVIDFFDLVRGFQSGDTSRAHPYEVEFLQKVLTKDKIVDRFRKYFGGKKAMNNRTAKKGR